MSTYSLSSPFPIFTDADGSPLEDGYIYIGTVNQNPETTPMSVYWDADLTIPAAQPIRTSGGYPVRYGTPARLYTGNQYSMTVRDKKQKLVYTTPKPTEAPPTFFVSVIDPKFGADPTGNSDSRAAIQACIDYAQSLGGGIVYFPPGNYRLDSPGVLGHLNLVNYSNIYMLGYGAKLTSTMMDESRMFWSFDGARNIVVDGFELRATFVRSGSTHVTGGVGAFRLAASSQDSNNISIRNIRAYDVYYFLTATKINDTYRVRGITIDNCLGVNGYYGLNFQNEGDLVTARNFRTANFVRTYFPYGVSNHDIQYESRGGDVFTDCLIKAYNYDTTDIKVTAKIINNTSNDSHVTLESQHPPATQPNPAVLKNIELNIDDLQASGTGPSLLFAYWQDTPSPTPTPTSSVTLFNNVRVNGNMRNYLQFAVAQPVNSGAISLAGLVYNLTGSGDPYDFGFYEPTSRYTQGDNAFSFHVKGNKGFAVDGTYYFRDYAGNDIGVVDGTVGIGALRFLANPNKPYQFYYATDYPAGTNVLDVNSSGATSFGFKVYEGANNGAPNAANAVVKIGQMNVSGRSLNAAGTLNAAGADYAEYEVNNGLTISRGSIVGFKVDGTLTLNFSEAVRFAIKSTNPSFVGGDTWCSETIVGPAPVQQPRKLPTFSKELNASGHYVQVLVDPGDTDAEWATKQSIFQAAWDAYQARIEVERAKVDRVAYSGKVPVNVIGAKPSEYIVATAGSDGKILGTSVANPDFAQYLRAVGRVNRVLPDGRAEVAVIIH